MEQKTISQLDKLEIYENMSEEVQKLKIEEINLRLEKEYLDPRAKYFYIDSDGNTSLSLRVNRCVLSQTIEKLQKFLKPILRNNTFSVHYDKTIKDPQCDKISMDVFLVRFEVMDKRVKRSRKQNKGEI